MPVVNPTDEQLDEFVLDLMDETQDLKDMLKSIDKQAVNSFISDMNSAIRRGRARSRGRSNTSGYSRWETELAKRAKASQKEQDAKERSLITQEIDSLLKRLKKSSHYSKATRSETLRDSLRLLARSMGV